MNKDKKAIMNILLKKYKSFQDETYMLDYVDGKYICVYWHHYNDKYIELNRLRNICNEIRKHTDLPVYTSFGMIK